MQSLRRRLPLTCLLLVGALGCEAGTPVTVQLDWVPSVTFAGVLVAKQKGWYEEAGLDVVIAQINLEAMATSVGPVLKGTNMIGIADGLVLLDAPGLSPVHHGAPKRANPVLPRPGRAKDRPSFV